jgi:hypothetical protein
VADARHDAEALRLDEDLAFFAFFGADLVAIAIVSAQGTKSHPSRTFRWRFFNFLNAISKSLQIPRSFLKSWQFRRILCHISRHAGDEDAFGDAGFFVGGGLEALARGGGESN